MSLIGVTTEGLYRNFIVGNDSISGWANQIIKAESFTVRGREVMEELRGEGCCPDSRVPPALHRGAKIFSSKLALRVTVIVSNIFY